MMPRRRCPSQSDERQTPTALDRQVAAVLDYLDGLRHRLDAGIASEADLHTAADIADLLVRLGETR